MIEYLKVERFKSLASVELSLGPLNLLIGANASGKSNLLDALRVLQGVGYNFTVSEIFDGKPSSASNIVWDGIRGGSKGAVLKQQPSKSREATCHFAARFRVGKEGYEFDITLDPEEGAVVAEKLVASGKVVYETEALSKQSGGISTRVYGEKQDESVVRQYFTDRPIYYQVFSASNVPEPQWSMRAISAMFSELIHQQHLNLIPGQLRQYSKGPSAKRIGEKGENFAALVNTIAVDSQVREEYISWLRELVPAEVKDIELLPGAVGDVLFAIKEDGAVFPAPVISDGTLRFAALAAALFQPDMPRIILLEEIENGIHPTRLRLLVEMLRSRAGVGKPQILATTHSPVVLAWLTETEYAHTFLCARDENGLSTVRPLSSIPHLIDIVRRTPLSGLFAEGWLETAL